MQNTITLQQNESQRLFDNSETAKNNDVARKSEIASVTGYAPDEWVISNNPYMNDDGTIKDEYKNVDFSAVMAQAKASGNTAAYNAAATARFIRLWAITAHTVSMMMVIILCLVSKRQKQADSLMSILR